MIFIILAILSGVTIVLSRSINYVLAEKIGTYQSTFFNYVLGLMGSVILLFISGESLGLFRNNLSSISWWAYTGGLVGIIVVSLSIFLSSKITSFYLTLLMFVGQLFAGIIIDYLASGTLSIYQIIGGLLVIIGLVYNLYIDTHKN